jgi:hypothetical protein
VLKELKHLSVALSSVIKFFIALLEKKEDMNKCLKLGDSYHQKCGKCKDLIGKNCSRLCVFFEVVRF